MLNRSPALTVHNGDLREVTGWRVEDYRPVVLWLTGPPASGKSSLADALEIRLHELRVRAYTLDGDKHYLRHGMGKHFGIFAENGKEDLRKVAEASRLFLEAGLVTVAAFASPDWEDRLMLRQQFPAGSFIEIYLKCESAVRRSRDRKGPIADQRSSGLADEYDEPMLAELVVETDRLSVEQSVQRIISFLAERRVLTFPGTAPSRPSPAEADALQKPAISAWQIL